MIGCERCLDVNSAREGCNSMGCVVMNGDFDAAGDDAVGFCNIES